MHFMQLAYHMLKVEISGKKRILHVSIAKQYKSIKVFFKPKKTMEMLDSN